MESMGNTENTDSMEELAQAFEKLVEEFRGIHVKDIPDIDLYMDQVTTFMDQHLSSSVRNPSSDKILTKTMINNYAKNNLLIPPVNKKYGRDHMVLLILIFYLKSYLSIGDIGAILRPLQDNCTEIGRRRAEEERRRADRKKNSAKENGAGEEETAEQPKAQESMELQDIYDRLVDQLEEQMPVIAEQARADFEAAGRDFADAPADGRSELQTFDLICRMSMEIYVRKLFIERLIDRKKFQSDVDTSL